MHYMGWNTQEQTRNFLKYNLEVALLKYLSFIGPRAISLAFPFKMLRLHRVILTFVLIFDINTGIKNKLNVGQIDKTQTKTAGIARSTRWQMWLEKIMISKRENFALKNFGR